MIIGQTAFDENGQEYIVMGKNSVGKYVQVMFARNYRKENGVAVIDIPLVLLHSDNTFLPVFLKDGEQTEENLIQASVVGDYIKVPVRG